MRVNRSPHLFGWIIALIMIASHPGWAAVPHLIRYQGTLTDAAGAPLDGPQTLTFRFYDAETDGTKLWEETQTGVPVTKGAFSVLLGQVTSLDLAFDRATWLAISVNAGPELIPRHRVASVPTAYRAERAEQAEGGVDRSVRVTSGADLSLPNQEPRGAHFKIPFNQERWDTDNMHSEAADPTRLVARTAGKYYIFGNVSVSAQPTGVRLLVVVLNGTTAIAMLNADGSAHGNRMQISTHYYLNAGDYVELELYQDSGTNLTLYRDPNWSPDFGMVKVP